LAPVIGEIITSATIISANATAEIRVI
jgi:hypothetical protein